MSLGAIEDVDETKRYKSCLVVRLWSPRAFVFYRVQTEIQSAIINNISFASIKNKTLILRFVDDGSWSVAGIVATHAVTGSVESNLSSTKVDFLDDSHDAMRVRNAQTIPLWTRWCCAETFISICLFRWSFCFILFHAESNMADASSSWSRRKFSAMRSQWQY